MRKSFQSLNSKFLNLYLSVKIRVSLFFLCVLYVCGEKPFPLFIRDFSSVSWLNFYKKIVFFLKTGYAVKGDLTWKVKLNMKRRFHHYIILTVSLTIILQIISGYTATAVEKEVSEIEKLYRYKCSLCHPVPDIDESSYTYQEWLNVMNAMHQPGRYSESVDAEDDARIKAYLRTMSKR